MNKKIVIILVLSLFFISSCVLNTEKTIDKLYENPVIDDNKDNNGENNQNTEPSNKFLDNHKLNPNNFDGHGMEYRILCANVINIDPRSDSYPYKDKEWRLKIIEEVEKAYNIKISFTNKLETKHGVISAGFSRESSYDDSMEFIAEEAGNDITDLDYAFYALYGFDSEYFMSSCVSWKEANFEEFLYPLEMSDGTGLFSEKGYTQNNLSSSLTTKDGIQYGFTPMYRDYNDSYMYYNIKYIKTLGLTDPVELWLKGEWNLSTFNLYVDTINNEISKGKKISSDCKVLGFNEGIDSFVSFYTSFKASLGSTMTDNENKIFNFEDTLGIYDSILTTLSVIDNKKIIWNYSASSDCVFHALNDITMWGLTNDDNYLWIPSKSLDGRLSDNGINIVPYPLGNDEIPVIKTSTNIEDALYNIYGEPITDDDGNYIIGVNIDNTKYQYPIYKNENSFMIPNFKVGVNGITPEISFDILYDLFANYDEEEIIESKRIELDDLVIYDRFDKTSLAVINSVNNESKAYIEMAPMLASPYSTLCNMDIGARIYINDDYISDPQLCDMLFLDIYSRQNEFEIDQKFITIGNKMKEMYQAVFDDFNIEHTYTYMIIKYYGYVYNRDGHFYESSKGCYTDAEVFPWYWLH